MNRTIANIISYLFHPLLVTTYIYAILIYRYSDLTISLNPGFKLHFLAAIFLMSFVIPGVSSYFLMKSGYVSTLKMDDLNDRRMPYLFTSIIYIINTFFFFKTFSQEPYFYIIIATITLSIIIVSVISIWWKISAHSTGVGGLLGFVIVCSILNSMQFDLEFTSITILICGLVMSGRLALNSHNIWQVLSGFFLGLLLSFLSLIILLFYV